MITFEYLREVELNPYEFLGVENSAARDEIKKAYKKLVLQYHPDKSKDAGDDKEEEEAKLAKFLLISDVYKFLTEDENEAEKTKYDYYLQREQRFKDNQDIVMQDVNEKKEKLRKLEKQHRENVERKKQEDIYRDYQGRMEKQKREAARKSSAERKRNMIDGKLKSIVVTARSQTGSNVEALQVVFEKFGRVEKFAVVGAQASIEFESVSSVAKVENAISRNWEMGNEGPESASYSKLLRKLVKEVRWNGVALSAGSRGVVHRRLTEMYPNSGKLSLEDFKEMSLLRYVTSVEGSRGAVHA